MVWRLLSGMKNLVFKNDGLGYGDQVGCCPTCGKPFVLPLKIAFSKNKPKNYPCSNCGEMINIK